MRSGFWLLTSQAWSSLGNLILAVLIARGATAEQFATFALVLPVYVVLQRIVRVYLLIPRQIALSRPGGLASDGDHPGAATSVLGFLAGAALVVWSLMVQNPWLGVLGVGMPGLLAFDCLRSEVLVRRKMWRVAVLDCCWTVIQLSASCVVIALDLAPVWLLIAWITPASLITGVVAVTWRANAWPIKGGLLHLWRARGRVSDGLSDLFSSVVVIQAIPYLVWAIAGLTVAGAFRAGQILLGPVNIAVMSQLPQLQMSAAEVAHDRQAVMSQVRKQTIALASMCAAYGAVLVAIPDPWGVALLGPTWSLAEEMLVGLAVLGVARVPFMALVTAMRSAGVQRVLVRQRLIGSGLLVLGACLGAATSMPAFIPIGMAIAAAISAIWALLALRAHPWPANQLEVSGV